MHLHLGGHLNYFDAMKRINIEIKIVGRQRLTDLLAKLKIPVGEIFLVSVNGEVMSLEDAWIQSDDEVQLYPPMGGG
ncbi:MAG: MoaD/ThiS family protein [Chloroflexi bacterium]|nr:MoaD/ThiS family protein [Chloroflexota bacterium]